MQVFSIYYTRPLVGFFNQVLWPSVFRHFIRQLPVFSLEELINMSVSVGFFFFFPLGVLRASGEDFIISPRRIRGWE